MLLPGSKKRHGTVQGRVSGLQIHASVNQPTSSLVRLDQALARIEPTVPKSMVQRPPSLLAYLGATCLSPLQQMCIQTSRGTATAIAPLPT